MPCPQVAAYDLVQLIVPFVCFALFQKDILHYKPYHYIHSFQLILHFSHRLPGPIDAIHYFLNTRPCFNIE